MGSTTPTPTRTRPIDVMVAGAQKAGTTSLKEHLGGAAGVCTHRAREFVYFVNDEEYALGYDRSASDSFVRTAAFDSPELMVAKSVGVMSLPVAIERLHAHNPRMRIVLLLREPVGRAYSGFWHARRMGWEPLEDFEEAFELGTERFGDDWVRTRNCAYEGRGRYVEHLRSIYALFPREQVQVHLFDDFVRDPKSVCTELWNWLGLDLGTLPDFTRKHNSSALPRSRIVAKLLSQDNPMRRAAKKLMPRHLGRRLRIKLRRLNERDFSPPPIEPELKARLREHFRPYNDELAELLERDLGRWNP